MTVSTRTFLVVPLLIAMGCGSTNAIEPEDGLVGCDNHPPDGSDGQSVDALVSYSCVTRQDTGYVNGRPFTITVVNIGGIPMERDTANALLTMSQAAENSGVLIRVASGFRTMAQQQYFWNCYINKNCNQGNLAARPGYSNHQSGHAVDLNTHVPAVFNWLNAHGATYGFRRTVPSEIWHWEWWGAGVTPTKYCGACACTSGVQNQACGNCGSQSRSCDGCNWRPWTACAGADPQGGAQVCTTGAKGVCEEARTRCIGGNLACVPVSNSSAEVCDGLDNDCNGLIDDGRPAVGAQKPLFASSLVDVSYPRTLKRGERASIWVEFRNEGSSVWTRENLWLSARAPQSQLYAAGSWPAFNVAAVLETPVQPGEVGRFAFDIVGAEDARGELTETFQLMRPEGLLVGCPQGEIAPLIRMMDDEVPYVVETSDVEDVKHVEMKGGCSTASGAPGLLALAALALLRRRSKRLKL